MKPVEEIFTRYKVIFDKLESSGFKKDGDSYIYHFDILGGEFSCYLYVAKDGTVTDKIIEKEFGDEFFAINSDNYIGSFVNNVREAYKEELIRIRESCFRKVLFKNDQANRIVDLVKEMFNEDPDFPFDKLENYAVFRYHKNRKWYGLIMNIKGSLLDANFSDSEIEIINLKINPDQREELLSKKGIYPGYHMNRENWASVVLDNSLSDQEVITLLDVSRNYAISSKKERKDKTLYWLQPVNPSYFDIDLAFKRNEVIMWKQSRNVRIGDICYIYVASPVKAIKYKCEVVQIDIPFEYKDENVKMTTVMKIKKLNEYKGSIEFLKEAGVKMIRGPVLLNDDIVKKIEELNKR